MGLWTARSIWILGAKATIYVQEILPSKGIHMNSPRISVEDAITVYWMGREKLT